MDQAFLGTGMKFPPQIDPATGRFMTVSAGDSIRESVYLILMTHQGERLMRPQFGSGLLSYTFMDVSPMSLNMLRRELSDILTEQEPRITDVYIDTEEHARDGFLVISISYMIRATNVRDNLVFPFYLNAEAFEEEEKESEYYEPEVIEVSD